MKKDGTPLIIDEQKVKDTNLDHIEAPEERKKLSWWLEQMARGRPFLEPHRDTIDYNLANVSLSLCYSCNDVAIWIFDRLVWPQRGEAPLPNPDLPEHILRDYEEAGTILDLSPRGATALLRLGIQRLCEHLGEKGKNINEDIASLVQKGLDVQVQQSLDVVRVIGNHAVHPGLIDLRDDRATAERLFGLVNLIAEIMISRPKHVKEMYESLPEDARKAIEKRDGKK
jgi:hypothetical protein